MFPILRQLIRCFFFPQVCCLCERWVHYQEPRPLCAECLGKLRPLTEPVCPVCGIPVPADILSVGHLCSTCREKDPLFDKARSWGLYGGLLRKTIHHFKFDGLRHLDLVLGDLLWAAYEREFAGDRVEILMPVPIHRRRLRERGYDQTLLLAQRLSKRTGLPVDRSIRRSRHTAPQFGLDLGARRKNLRGAFSIDRVRPPTDRRVLILDDVMTTGTTVTELARVLVRAAHPQWVGVLTLGRVFHFAD